MYFLPKHPLRRNYEFFFPIIYIKQSDLTGQILVNWYLILPVMTETCVMTSDSKRNRLLGVRRFTPKSLYMYTHVYRSIRPHPIHNQALLIMLSFSVCKILIHTQTGNTGVQLPFGYSWIRSSPCQGADATKNDGVYSRFFTAFDTNGRYSIKIWALGGITTDKQRTLPQNGVMYIDGWIENGKWSGDWTKRLGSRRISKPWGRIMQRCLLVSDPHSTLLVFGARDPLFWVHSYIL